MNIRDHVEEELKWFVRCSQCGERCTSLIGSYALIERIIKEGWKLWDSPPEAFNVEDGLLCPECIEDPKMVGTNPTFEEIV